MNWRQGDLFSDLSPKKYRCNVCGEWLQSFEFDKHGGLPSRDFLQRTCKDCRSESKRGEKKEGYCDLCNTKGFIVYSLEEDGTFYYFCGVRCFLMWTRPDDYYE